MLENTLSSSSDSLSVALSKMKLRAFNNVALDAGGRWAIDFPAYDGFTLNVVQKGECRLAIEGRRETIHLESGDCFLLTGGRKFSLGSDLTWPVRLRAEELYAEAHDGRVTCQGGGDFLVIGTIFRFEGHLPSLLFGRLPPVIHVKGGSDQTAVLRWSLERFSTELRGNGVGRSLFLGHLAPIMLLQMLRIYLASAPKDENWLVALSHPRLSKVLAVMQSKYERNWTLDQLADLAGMSRSGFALTFKNKVGVPPMVYLTNWRIQIACELLEAGEDGVSTVAAAVGYRSESAFSVAFRNIVKCRPGAYRRPNRSELNSPAAEMHEAVLKRPGA